jgi:Carboxypeptidase regulatory-like domain
MISLRPSAPALVCAPVGRFLCMAAEAIAVLLICVPLFSQTNQGRIQGGVFDQTGGAIAGATVTVTDVARGVARALVTDSAGEYSAISLVPGMYTVRGEAKGFKAVEHTGVLVQVGEDIRVDLTLQAGEQSQTVTVTAEIPQVETTNATLGGALSNETINDLPLNGRDFTRMVQLRPGVVSYPGGGDHSDSANGFTSRDGLWLLDGALAYNPVNGGQIVNYRYQAGPSSSTLPVDAIQEFNTQENPRAEYGWAVGALINVGLKSGTNSLHGTAYAFGRGTGLDARNYFNQPTLSNGAPNPKTPVELEQYGATAGGPIIKDKLFWFVGYEGEQLSVGDIYVGSAPASVSLPSFSGGPQNGCSVLTTGNCSASLVDACNDIGRTNVNALSAQLAGLPVGSCIPQPASSTFENVFPFNPGTNPAGPTAFAPFPLPNTTTENNGIVKINYHINDHQALSASYFIADMPNALWVTSPDQLTAQMQNLITVRTRVFGSNWTYTPNSSWVNELRVGTNSITEIDTGPDNKNSQALPWPTGFGIPTGVSNPADFGMPYVQISSLNNFALGHGSTTRFRGPGGTTEVGDNISYLRGKHSFKFGGDFFYLRLADNNLRQVQGRIKFNDIESFLSGNPHKGNILTGNPQVRQRDASGAGFIQDDWRTTKTLTLNLGLRYEFMPPSWEIDNQFGSFNPSLGLVQGWTVRPDYRNISPRLGLAWDINGNAKTVVRAAGSIIYQTADFYAGLGDGATAVPFGYDIVVNGVTKTGSQVGSGSATFSGSQLTWNTTGPIFPAVVGRLQCGDGVGPDPGPCDTNFVDPNIRTPRVTNWNLDLQRALTSNLTLDVAYVGNHSHGQARPVQINQPALGAGWFSPLAQSPTTGAAACLSSAPLYNNCSVFNPYNTPLQPLYSKFPYIGFLDETENVGYSNYNALQVTLTQRRYHGLYFLAAYSYSHGLDDFYGAPPQRGGLQDNANPGLDYGTSDYDIKHRFTVSLTYAFPGKKAPAQLLEGWSLNSIVTLQSGLPWSATDTNDDFAGTNALNDSSQSLWDFKGNPSDFTSGPNAIPCFSNLASTMGGCAHPVDSSGNFVPPAVCMNAAQANGPLAVASLMNLGCYVKGNSVLTPPAYGSLGNMSRNMFRDSGFRNWDFSILKDWKFKERLNAQFRAEFFNILNHPNFANPYGAFTTYYNNDPSTGLGFGCGCITPDAAAGNFVLGSGGARDIQLGLKLIF